MGEGFNIKTLKKNILSLSEASEWEAARKEWHLVDVIQSQEPETCLCGHYPIIEICTIHNKITRKNADVGNICVKKFLGFNSDKIFSALKRIRKDTMKSLNLDSIAFFKEQRALTGWEYDFLLDTRLKRELSEKQLAKRKAINEKILSLVARRGFHC